MFAAAPSYTLATSRNADRPVHDLVIENATLPLATRVGTQAVAVAAGRVVAIAGDAGDFGAARRRLDLGGRALLPGFNDAHVHIWKVGHLLTSLVDLRSARSLSEVCDRLVRRGEQQPEGYVLGRGVNELALAEGRLPTRQELDAWLPGRCVWVTRACNHVGLASTAAMQAAGIDSQTSEPAGGTLHRDAAGEPIGRFDETAMGLVARHVPSPTEDELQEMIRAAIAKQRRLGITAATDPGVDDRVLRVYRELDASGELVGRYNVMRLGPEDDHSDAMAAWEPPSATEHLRVDTAKFFLDGGLSGATAALSVAYRHADTTGVLRYTTDEYAEVTRRAAAAGYRTATHVIGDRAIATALDALQTLPAEVARRARFEHLGLPTATDLERIAAYGIGVATQTIFLPELGANFRAYLPEDFPVTPYPMRAMLDAGIDVALSTDAPVVVDERPLAGIAAAVLRLDGRGEPIGREQAITVREGLEGYTAAGARLSGDAERFGTIAAGQFADLVVLDRNPLLVDPGELTSVRVDMTLVGGEVVYER